MEEISLAQRIVLRAWEGHVVSWKAGESFLIESSILEPARTKLDMLRKRGHCLTTRLQRPRIMAVRVILEKIR